MSVCDVLVVGGGPAGAAAATALAQRGREVVLVDKAAFPREKICGEGLSPEAWTALRELGAAEAVAALEPQPLLGMRLTAPDGTSFEGRYQGHAGLGVRRLHLDAALLAHARAAGVSVLESTRAEPLAPGGAEVRIAGAHGDTREMVRARVVVCADGRGGALTSRLGLARPARLRKFAVRGHWQGVAALGDLGEMHVGGGGYCGVAPLSLRRGEANLALVLDASEMAAAGGRIEDFYRATLHRWPRVAARLERASLMAPPQATGPLASEVSRLTLGNLVLCGDAAGFYDPFTGEGVTLALRSALLAAEAIDDHLRAGTALSVYETRRRERTRAKFRFNRLLQQVVARPGLANQMAARLQRRPDLADTLVGVAGDFVPAQAALRLGMLFDLLRA